MSEPDITEEEYREKITELAKKGIRKNVIHNDHLVDTDELYRVTDAIDDLNGSDSIDDLIDNHPDAVSEYTPNEADEWWPDSKDVLSGMTPLEATRLIKRRIVKNTIQQRAEELLNGEWDAIETVEVEREVVVHEREVTLNLEADG